jgi:hypothetical protein
VAHEAWGELINSGRRRQGPDVASFAAVSRAASAGFEALEMGQAGGGRGPAAKQNEALRFGDFENGQLWHRRLRPHLLNRLGKTEPMIERRWLHNLPVAVILYTLSYVDRTNISLAPVPTISTRRRNLRHPRSA